MNECKKIDRKDFILYVMGLIPDKMLSPVQAQKLFFLIDEKLSNRINGEKFFNFQPYDYGPFDKAVYDDLNTLIQNGHIESILINGIKHFKLKTPEISNGISFDNNAEIKNGLEKLIHFVKNCSFKELLVAIYNEYPDMAKNTVFKGWKKDT